MMQCLNIKELVFQIYLTSEQIYSPEKYFLNERYDEVEISMFKFQIIK